MKSRYLIFFIILYFFCLSAKSAFAGDYWEITQITDNDYDDVAVEMYGEKLTWQGRPPDSPNNEIFYYDGNKIIRLTHNDVYECPPSISSGGIVWQAYRPKGGSDVYYYDFNEIKRLTNDKKDDFRVTIYGNTVVWCKARQVDGEIIVYDGNAIKAVPNAYGIFPRVSSCGILYSNLFDDHIYVYDWHEIIDMGFTDVEFTDNPHNQQISRNKIVFRKYVEGFHDVFVFDITTRQTARITYGEENPETWNYGVSIKENYIAWKNRKDDKDILRLYDGKEVYTLAYSYDISEPFFGDGFLVWSMKKSKKHKEPPTEECKINVLDIYLYDLKSKKIFQITDDRCSDRYPIASGKYIAWQKHDGKDYEICLAYIKLP